MAFATDNVPRKGIAMSVTEKPTGVPQQKKAYTSPVLQVYGTIQALTASTANSMFARGDGGGSPSMDKTH
jgi:hypothetical protein